jgi:hypothetical protein
MDCLPCVPINTDAPPADPADRGALQRFVVKYYAPGLLHPRVKPFVVRAAAPPPPFSEAVCPWPLAVNAHRRADGQTGHQTPRMGQCCGISLLTRSCGGGRADGVFRPAPHHWHFANAVPATRPRPSGGAAPGLVFDPVLCGPGVAPQGWLAREICAAGTAPPPPPPPCALSLRTDTDTDRERHTNAHMHIHM